MHGATRLPHASPPGRALVAVFVAALLAYLWFPSVWGWNENSRIGLVRAVVEQRTLSIDDYWQRPGNETRDVSEHGGRVYSDKAIGTAVLGVPAYWAARPLLSRYDAEPERLAHMVRTLVSWVSVALPSAIACVALFALAWRASGEAVTSVTTAVAGALGTPQWPLSTTLFGHATAGALLLVALFLGRELRRGTPRPLAVSATIGGVLGLAVITEYPPALVAAILGAYFLYAVVSSPGRRSPGACVAAAIVAGLAPLGLLMAYDQACFGSPFTLSYSRIANPEFAGVHAQGMLGVGVPDARRLLYLTVHPARGVFVQSPILLAGLAGLAPMFARRGWRLEAGVVLAAFVVLLLVNAGFPVWWGGRSVAARHMVPAMLLACLPIAFLGRRWRPLVGALLAVSVVQMAIATAGDPEPPDDGLAARVYAGEPLPWRGTSPIWGEGLRSLASGDGRPTVGSRLGLLRGRFARAGRLRGRRAVRRRRPCGQETPRHRGARAAAARHARFHRSREAHLNTSTRLSALALSAALAAGCAGMDETRQNTAAGATMGALGGAVIGSMVHGPRGAWTGAALGAAAGGGGAYMWSRRMEEQKRAMEQATQGTGVAVTQTPTIS